MDEERIRVSLSRDLTLFDITMIGIAGMIGAGIFALTGFATGLAGPAVLLAFLLNGVIATFTGLAYAELGAALPEAGGGIIWIKEALGNYFAFFAGWINWIAHTIACALYAVTFGAFFSEFLVMFLGFEGILQATMIKMSAVGIVTMMTYLNYLGAKESGRFGGFITLFKIFILVVFAGFGIYRTLTQPDWIATFTLNPSFIPNGATGILVAMGFTFIAFEGYEIIVQSGEEVKDPDRNIPLAIIISLWTAVLIYILVAFALMGSIRSDIPSWTYLGQLGEFSMIRVADQIMPLGAIVIIIGGLVSTLSAMNATVYSSSRVAFALGRMGHLPESLSRINERNRTPHFAIFFSYILIALMALAPIEYVAAVADVMFIILFVMVNSVLIILRLRRPDIKRTFKMPLVPYLPIIAIISQIAIGYFLITEIEHATFIVEVAIVWFVAGSFVYYSYSEKELKKRTLPYRRKVYEEKPLELEGYKILVPVKNRATAPKLARLADSIAKAKNAHIIFLEVITLPESTPLSAAHDSLEKQKSFIKDLLEKASVPAGGILKVGRKASENILDTIEEEKPDLVLMGWRGRTFRSDFILGSTIDMVLLKARCDVAIVRFSKDEDVHIKKILLPTAGGPHSSLAAELANDIAGQEDSMITILHVGETSDVKEQAMHHFEGIQEILQDVRTTEKFLVSGNVTKTIAAEADKNDVMFIGATNRLFLKNFLLGVFPEKIIQKTDKTMIMTRKWVKMMDVLK
ncbi:MAG: amino acid permease [Methanosarcinaceae archaeon]|nr:amino acid permease [Methanosarcinaceae archaeon]